jgi:phosphatidate cytidylyltransferase
MNIVKRFWTAFILLAAVFAVLQYGGRWVMFLFVQAVIIAALVEFYNLARRRHLHPRTGTGIFLVLLLGASFIVKGLTLELALFFGLLGVGLDYLIVSRTIETAVQSTESITVTLFGAVYIGFTLDFLFPLRETYGSAYIYFLMAVIFLADTGAFFVGKAIGRHSMTRIASPHKTWEGAAGGLLFAGLAAWAARTVFLPEIDLGEAIAAGLSVSIVAQISDPVESLFKRAAGVKDSSKALPGHGGFLDRIDSLLFAVPFFYFLVRYLWKPAG